MKLYVKNYPEVIFVFFYLIFHLYFFDLDPINDEYIFYTGAELIKTSKIELIEIFFLYNANTLGFSYLIFLLSKILNVDNLYLLSKIISCSGYLFLYFGLLNFFKLFKIEKRLELIVLIFFCPLIFIYGFRATPDFFSFSLSFFSSTFILNSKNIFKKILYFLLLSIAVIIKPINGITLIFIFLYFFLYKKKELYDFKNILGFLLFTLLTFIFFYFNYKNFGFLVRPPNWTNLDTTNKNLILNFIYYLGFLNLCIFPFVANYILKEIVNIKKAIVFFIFILIIFTYLFFNFKESLNEINFGFISSGIGELLMKFFFGLNASILLFYFYIKLTSKGLKNLNALIIFYIIIYLFVISHFSPVQRYLMILLPIIYYLASKEMYTKIIYNTVLIIYIVFNLLILSNHLVLSDLSKKTRNFLIKEKILEKTYVGFFGQHSLSKFVKFYDNNFNKIIENIVITKSDEKEALEKYKTYRIVDKITGKEEVIFNYSSKIFFINKEVFVVKHNK